jgi:predicted nuclease of predicted toxin-antitoxin system
VKFKLDENLPVELVTDLRGLGHDADTVTGEGLRDAADPAVVDAAFAADRILFTLRTPDLAEFRLTQVCRPTGDPYRKRLFPWR